MKAYYWILVGNSCVECDVQGATLMAREPTTDDMAAFSEELGGMYCITVNTYRVQVPEHTEGSH